MQCVAFNSDDCIVSSSTDNTVRTWDTRKGRAINAPLLRFDIAKGDRNQFSDDPNHYLRDVIFVSISDDKQRALIGTDDETLQIWSIEGEVLIGNYLDLYHQCLYSESDSSSEMETLNNDEWNNYYREWLQKQYELINMHRHHANRICLKLLHLEVMLMLEKMDRDIFIEVPCTCSDRNRECNITQNSNKNHVHFRLSINTKSVYAESPQGDLVKLATIHNGTGFDMRDNMTLHTLRDGRILTCHVRS